MVNARVPRLLPPFRRYRGPRAEAVGLLHRPRDPRYGWNIVAEVIGTFALVFGVFAIVDNAAPGEAGLAGTPPSAPRARLRLRRSGASRCRRSPDPVRTQAFLCWLMVQEQPVGVH
jgi:glycerol uptake facilitator-like aquaporin